jgi:aerobic carbon-monoxide dehydrogenase medium subunit
LKFLMTNSMSEALDTLHAEGPVALIIAGGTDVMVQLARGELRPAVLVNVEAVSELRFEESSTVTRIGALVSQRELAESSLVKSQYGALSAAANLCGGWQTQFVGTVGGNVCNASPAADLTPALMAHGAVVLLKSKARGQREVPLHDFVLGRRQTARLPDELVIGFELDIPPRRTADAFEKVGRRGAMEISIVSVATRMTLSEDNRVDDVRIALGSVGPRPFRARKAEKLMIGETFGPDLMAEAAEAVLKDSSPIDDVRGSRNYRRAVLPRVFLRTLQRCADRINPFVRAAE